MTTKEGQELQLILFWFSQNRKQEIDEDFQNKQNIVLIQ